MNETEKTASNEEVPTPLNKYVNNALQFYDDLIHDFKKRADRHKRRFNLLTYSSVCLAIAVTLVSTLVISLTATQEIYLWVIPIIGGLSALSTTL